MPTGTEILERIRTQLEAAGRDVDAAIAETEELEDILDNLVTAPGPSTIPPAWHTMDQHPPRWGHYRVKMRVYGQEMIGYSTWTGHQWCNCFPVQKRFLWAYPPGGPPAQPSTGAAP